MRRLKTEKRKVDRSALVRVYERGKLIGLGRLEWVFYRLYHGGIAGGTERIEGPTLHMRDESPDLTGRDLRLHDSQREVWYSVRLDEPAPYTKQYLISSIWEEPQQ